MRSAEDSNQKNRETDIKILLEKYHAAMLSADTAALDELLVAQFFLVHITGYRQPKAEWIEMIETRQFDYHSIDVESNQLPIKIEADSATVIGRGVFHATINGINRAWRLQFNINLKRSDGSWKVLQSSYRSF